MFEIAAVLGLGILCFLFAYIAFKVSEERVHLQLTFFILSLLFAASLVYVISDFSLNSQTLYSINETTTYTYGNYTDAGGGNHTLAVSEVTTYNYGNLSDYSHQNEWYLTHFGVLEVLIIFVLLYLFLLVLISVFNALWIKGRDREELDGGL